jgi:hypothetical protein
MNNKRENIPNAATLISSMRSIGYDFETAVADIIDNSITARAKQIEIFFPVNNDKIYLEIIDNGFGMDNEELFEAMRFGTIKDERALNDLGRFGLGLKTASISQCRKMTVISKKNDIYSGYCWDLDIIIKNQNWEIEELTYKEILATPNIDKYIHLNSFTIVFWENFDRLNKDVTIFYNLNDVFSKRLSSTEKHLALVFHRYLEEGIKISINNREIVPLDPFLQNHPKTSVKSEQIITTETSEGIKEKVKIQVFVLPYQKDLSKEDYEKLGGQDEIDSQGFYIYRNKRLMIHGTWFKIKPKAELSRNARIKVDIPNTLDDLWAIDIKKQKAIIPGVLLDQLRKEVIEAVDKSRKVYEYKGSLETKDGSIWNKIENQRDKSVYYEINKESNLIKGLIEGLDEKHFQSLQKILTLIELSLPYKDIYNSVSDKKEVNAANEDQADVILSEAYSLVMKSLKTTNQDIQKIIEKVCSYEPFRSANLKEILLEKINGR